MSTEVPLLSRICEQHGDPDLFPAEVLRLHAAGEAAAARRALQKHATTEHNAARRGTQMALAGHPYLWLEPMEGAPGLGTVAGIGVRMVGTHEPDDHGHALTIRCVTLLSLPVLPLGAHVVRDAEGGRRTVLADAPLPRFARVWQGMVALLFALGVGAVGWGIHHHRTHVDVLAYNGGPVPLQLQVGGAGALVAPGQHRALPGVPAGPVLLTASAAAPDGAPVEIERLEADLTPHGGGRVVYNAGGLGVFATTYVQYGAGEPPGGYLLGAESVIVVAHDHALEAPPDRVSLPSGEGGETRSVLEPLVDGWTEDRLSELLVEEHGLPDGVRYARAWVELDPEQRELHELSVLPLGEGDGQALRAVAQTAIALHPGSVEAHRLAQAVRLGLGEDRGALAREYGEWAAAAPTDPDRAVLHAWMLDGVDPAAAARLLEANLAAHPDHDWTHRALGQTAMRMDAPRRALAHLDAFVGEDPGRNRALSPVLLMLQRVADGAPWSPGVASRLERAARMGEAGHEIARRRLLHLAAARVGAVDELITGFEAEWGATGGAPLDPLDRAWITAQAATAGGWHGAAAPALDTLRDDPAWMHAAAELELLLALSDGGDRAGVSRALTVLTEEAGRVGELAVVIAAAERAVDPEASAARVARLREGAGPHDPCHVLRPDLDLLDAEAVRVAIGRVEPSQRGAAWAAVAVALDAQGEAAHGVARTARASARTWGYPGRVPHWED